MRPRFVGRLETADLFTTLNAGLGFVAVVTATVDVRLAARIVLVAAIADALDGIIARVYGGSEVGPYLDSLADVASFSVAPALIVVEATKETTLFSGYTGYVIGGVGAVFVAMGVLRLGMYTAFDTKDDRTKGVPTTLAATILMAGTLADLGPDVLFVGMAGFAVLMVTQIPYPDLRIRDAFVMGTVQVLAVGVPFVYNELFPKALLAWALAYLVLGPVYYRGEGKRS
ncbi:MAG: protein sorting system archaetidylserine synthase [Halodesulfurarchaeum sp.]